MHPNTRLPSVITAIMLSILSVTVIGCGNSQSIDISAVNGTVTLKGKGLGDLKLAFIRTDSANSEPAIVLLTGMEGQFAVGTSSLEPGLPYGKYRVVVTDLRAGAQGEGDEVKPIIIPSRFKKQYSDALYSPLEVTISEPIQTVNFTVD